MTGVEGVGGDGEGGVEGLFLSADCDLFGANNEDAGARNVLETLGDGERPAEQGLEGVGDLYLELTSLIRGRRVAIADGALFFSAGTNGGLGVSSVFLLLYPRSDSHTSIHTGRTRPH